MIRFGINYSIEKYDEAIEISDLFISKLKKQIIKKQILHTSIGSNEFRSTLALIKNMFHRKITFEKTANQIHIADLLSIIHDSKLSKRIVDPIYFTKNDLYYHCLKKAIAFIKLNRFDEAIFICKQLVEDNDLSNTSNLDPKSIKETVEIRLNALFHMARSYSKQGNHITSIERYEDIIHCAFLESDIAKCNAYSGIGYEYSRLGDYENATDYYKKALSLCEFNVDSVFEAETEKFYMTISICMDIAEFDLDFANEILKELVLPASISCVNENANGIMMLAKIADYYAELGSNDEAIKIYDSVTEYIKDKNMPIAKHIKELADRLKN